MNPKHYNGKPCKTCQSTLRYVRTYNCIKCSKAMNRTPRRSTVAARAHELWMNARARAKKSKLEFSITEEWVYEELQTQNGTCPMTGAVYSYTKPESSRTNPHRPSLDRIDSKQGYVFENLRICSWIYNRSKADFDDEAIQSFAWGVVKTVRRLDLGELLGEATGSFDCGRI